MSTADFRPDPARPRRLLLGEGAGCGPVVELALRLAAAGGPTPLVLLGVTAPPPFRARPSTILVPGMPAGVIAAHPLLDAQGIPSRLAAPDADLPGCHNGDLASLARSWLAVQDPAALARVELFAQGPRALLEAAAALVGEHGLTGRYAAG